MQIQSIGIDLGKTTFHLVALGSRGQVVVRKKFSRQQLLLYTANLPLSLIGMEACVGSHFLGRALREQGHEVRLIPAQFVRSFVKSNRVEKGTPMLLILLIIILVLAFGGGGGYYGYRRWGTGGGVGIFGLALIILVLLYVFGGMHRMPY